MSKIENMLKSVVAWKLETKADFRENNYKLTDRFFNGLGNFCEKYIYPIVKPLDDVLEKIRKYVSED